MRPREAPAQEEVHVHVRSAAAVALICAAASSVTGCTATTTNVVRVSTSAASTSVAAAASVSAPPTTSSTGTGVEPSTTAPTTSGSTTDSARAEARSRVLASGLEYDVDVDDPGMHYSVRDGNVVVGKVSQKQVDKVADAVDLTTPLMQDESGEDGKAKILVIVAANDADFSQFVGTGMPSDVAGVTGSSDNRSVPWTALSPQLLADDDETELDAIVAHELFHQITDVGPTTPGWLAEGFAEFASADQVAEFEYDMPAKAHLPTDAELLSDDANVGEQSYYLSAKFAAYLVDTYGLDTAMQFYREAVDHGVDPAATSVLHSSLDPIVVKWVKAYKPTPIIP